MMDATSVSHHSPDTDVSDEDALFEVRLNSAKLLFLPAKRVGVCMRVHVDFYYST